MFHFECMTIHHRMQPIRNIQPETKYMKKNIKNCSHFWKHKKPIGKCNTKKMRCLPLRRHSRKDTNLIHHLPKLGPQITQCDIKESGRDTIYDTDKYVYNRYCLHHKWMQVGRLLKRILFSIFVVVVSYSLHLVDRCACCTTKFRPKAMPSAKCSRATAASNTSPVAGKTW